MLLSFLLLKKTSSGGLPSATVSVTSFDIDVPHNYSQTTLETNVRTDSSTTSVRAEYIGIALPADINLLLESDDSPRNEESYYPNGKKMAEMSAEIHRHQEKYCLECLGEPKDTVNETKATQMTEETPEGRLLIRKECLRLIVNLSSSVGAKKVSEPGLLQ